MMIRQAAIIAAFFFSGFAAITAFAEEAKTGYSLTPFGNGFILLNRETGTVSQCRKQDSEKALICELASDDRKALEDRIKSLEKKLANKAPKQAQNKEPAPSRTSIAATETKSAPPKASTKPAGPSFTDQLANIGKEAMSRLFALADDLKAKL